MDKDNNQNDAYTLKGFMDYVIDGKPRIEGVIVESEPEPVFSPDDIILECHSSTLDLANGMSLTVIAISPGQGDTVSFLAEWKNYPFHTWRLFQIPREDATKEVLFRALCEVSDVVITELDREREQYRLANRTSLERFRDKWIGA